MTQGVKRRLLKVGLLLALIGGVGYFLLEAFQDNLMFFLTPTTLQERFGEKASQSERITKLDRATADGDKKQRLRLGGVVKASGISVNDLNSGDVQKLRFVVTDQLSDVVVEHQGFVPALFREGQGVVVEGYYDPKLKVFFSNRLLAKHDETYKIPQRSKGSQELKGVSIASKSQLECK